MNKRKQPSAVRSTQTPSLAPAKKALLTQLLVRVIEFRQTGRHLEVPALLDAALDILPKDPNLWLEKGVACFDLGQMDQAVQCYGKALALDPSSDKAYNNLGNALRGQKEYVSSVNAFLKAIELNPKESNYYINLGLSLRDASMNEAAMQAFGKALELNPLSPEPHFQLGLTCIINANPAAALGLLQKAIEFKPHDPLYLYNLAIAYKETQQLDLARATLDKTIQLLPGFTHAHYQKVLLARQQCDWSTWEQDIHVIRQVLNEGGDQTMVNPYLLITYPEFGAAEVKSVAERYMRHMTGAWNGKTLVPKNTLPHKHRKLRVGYLSADFCYHATAILMIGMLEARDTDSFETYLYSYKKNMPNDEWVSRCKYAADVYRDLAYVDDLQAAQIIMNDEIDILVDLKGFTTEARLNISMYRPAPILVSWLGYPGTLGHPQAADYIIGDAWVTPESAADHYSETLALMPHCYQPNMVWEALPQAPSRAALGLPENAVVFCNFNQTYKYTPMMFELWCKVMAAVPNSVLWLLKPSSPKAIQNILDQGQRRGVDSSRIVFAPKLDIFDHCVRLQQADLSLDTFPYTSHTTARDALWAGVPLVTKVGESFASRVAGSLLSSFGLPELVADSDEAFIQIATALASDAQRLSTLKQKTRDLRANTPLFDPELFARDIERLYAAMAQRANGDVLPRTPLTIAH